MTPTPGRIVHVGYGELPGITNPLPCRVAVVCGALTAQDVLPVSVFTMNAGAPVIPQYVDRVTGWHDPRSCTFPWPQGPNDGERSDPSPIELPKGVTPEQFRNAQGGVPPLARP